MLKPEVSIPVALATGTLVFGIFQASLPPIADARAVEAGDDHLRAAEKEATLLSAAAVAGVSLLAKDTTVFIVGGIMIVAQAWAHRHARSIDPSTGRLADWLGGRGTAMEQGEPQLSTV